MNQPTRAQKFTFSTGAFNVMPAATDNRRFFTIEGELPKLAMGRQSGRTTRMVEQARLFASHGQNVVVLAHSGAYARDLKQRHQALNDPRIKVLTKQKLLKRGGAFDMNSANLDGQSYKMLMDHTFVEQEFRVQLEAAFRWDAQPGEWGYVEPVAFHPAMQRYVSLAQQTSLQQAVRDALELYALSYDQMARIGRTGDVDCKSVAYDIRRNMVDSVLSAIARLAPANEVDVAGPCKAPATRQGVQGVDHFKAENCTCPTGDGSLSWPCPSHPPEGAQA